MELEKNLVFFHYYLFFSCKFEIFIFLKYQNMQFLSFKIFIFLQFCFGQNFHISNFNKISTFSLLLRNPDFILQIYIVSRLENYKKISTFQNFQILFFFSNSQIFKFSWFYLFVKFPYFIIFELPRIWDLDVIVRVSFFY